MRTSIPLLLSPLLVSFATARGLSLTVLTKNGPVKGHAAPHRKTVNEYLGIPFAEPPLGDLRFAPPVRWAPDACDGVFVADKFSDDCPQTSSKPVAYPLATPQEERIISVFANEGGNTQSEDCLYLNVWSKSTEKRNKPVMVFFYGGRWSIGASNSSFYNGEYLADAEDVVVVTLNFRINIFGYPGAPGESQNLGMQDQRVAIEWVRDNIAAFSGDPSKITIFGQSSGSVAVDYWAYAYPHDPIISGMISHSGDVFSFPINSPDLAAEHWYNVSGTLGCGTRGDVMPCMRQLNFSDISTAAAAVQAPTGTSLARSQPAFQPSNDSILVFDDYYSRSAQGKYAKIPYLLGNNENEAGYYKVADYAKGIILSDSDWNLFNLEDFTCAVSLEASNRVKNNVATYRYLYFGDWDNLRLYPTSGAYHGTDLEMIFGASADVSGLPESTPQGVVQATMMKAWVSFAADPADGMRRQMGWPRYNPDQHSLILLALNNGIAPLFVSPRQYDWNCTQFLSTYESV